MPAKMARPAVTLEKPSLHWVATSSCLEVGTGHLQAGGCFGVSSS